MKSTRIEIIEHLQMAIEDLREKFLQDAVETLGQDSILRASLLCQKDARLHSAYTMGMLDALELILNDIEGE